MIPDSGAQFCIDLHMHLLTLVTQESNEDVK